MWAYHDFGPLVSLGTDGTVDRPGVGCVRRAVSVRSLPAGKEENPLWRLFALGSNHCLPVWPGLGLHGYNSVSSLLASMLHPKRILQPDGNCSHHLISELAS